MTTVMAPNVKVAPYQTFLVTIAISDVANLSVYGIAIKYDPTILSCHKIENLLPSLSNGISDYDNTAGLVAILAGSYEPFSGSSPLCRIVFESLKEGTSPLTFQSTATIHDVLWSTKLLDKNMDPIPFTTEDGSVTVSSATLNGNVYDVNTHNPVDTAEVTLSHADHVVATGYTDEAGYYSLTVPVDVYTLTVAKRGYQTYTETGLNLTAGAYTHSDIFLASIAPDFSIIASPDSLSIQQGTSGSSRITVSSIREFNSPVQVTVSGMPEGMNINPNPFTTTPPPNADATQDLTITVAEGTPTGSYELTVMAISGSLTHSITISVGITPPPPPPPDFSLAASPSSVTVEQGNSGSSTITATSLNGFNSPIELTVAGQPSGVTATLDPTSVTPPADGSADSTLTIQVGSSATPGTYTLTVTGMTRLLDHSIIITLTVTALPPAPDFSLDVVPASLQIQQGQSAQAQVTVTSINSFNSAVTLSLPGGVPEKPTGSFSPNPITPPPNETAQSTLTVVVSDAVPAGPYTLTIIGTSGTLEHRFNITVTVTSPPIPDFSLSASPSSVTVQQGNSASSTITATSLNGFNSPIELTVAGQPSGVTATLDPTSVTPPADGSADSTLTIQVGSSATPGTYTLTVTGMTRLLDHSIIITLTVTALPPAPDFSLDVVPASLQIQQGQSAQAQVTVTSINSFNSAVTLSLPGGVPEKPTGSFSPNPITPPPNETAQSTLTVLVSDAVPAGPYTLTIIGTSGTLEHRFNITVTVTSPPIPDFSLSASPSSLTVQQGNSGSSTITATSIQGFNSPIELSVSGEPSGVTATLNPTSITPPADGSVNSTLTIQVDPSTAPGTYPLTVTGTSGSLTHTTTVTLQVTAPPPPQLSTVTGIVTGILWRPISGAKVTLNGKTATTDSNGLYTIENVSNGTYTLTIESSLYETFKTSLDITEPGTYTVDAQLGLLNIKKTYLLTGGLIFGTIIIVGAIAAHRK